MPTLWLSVCICVSLFLFFSVVYLLAIARVALVRLHHVCAVGRLARIKS